MKKVFFYLCILLVVSFLPAYAYSVKDITCHHYKIKHNQFYISNNTDREHLYMDAYLEEDSDDVGTSEKEKFSSKKTAFAIPSFVAKDVTTNTIKRIWATNYFLNFSQPCLICFRVLRL